MWMCAKTPKKKDWNENQEIKHFAIFEDDYRGIQEFCNFYSFACASGSS